MKPRGAGNSAGNGARKARRQGASRRPTGAPNPWRGWLARLGAWLQRAALAGGVAAALYFTAVALQAWLDKPVTSVKINGEFARVEREAAAERVYAAMGDSFIRLDLEAIRTALLAEPWIDNVRVQRRWPDGLEVTVVEHKPIARWGRRDALNHRGELIRLAPDSDADALLAGLPQLEGGPGMQQEVMAQYRVIGQMLQSHDMVVRRLVCDDTRSWSLELEDGVQMKLGRDNLVDRVQRFQRVYASELQARWAQLQGIDLRYFNGLAVQWRAEAGPEV